jgi:hypothetical protein
MVTTTVTEVTVAWVATLVVDLVAVAVDLFRSVLVTGSAATRAASTTTLLRTRAVSAVVHLAVKPPSLLRVA